MNKKHFYTAVILLSYLAIGIQSALGVINVPSQTTVNDTTIATWDSTNRIYTLTSNVTEGLVITEGNLTLNGDGHTITGSGSGTGISLEGQRSVTVKNLTVEGFTTGIRLYNDHPSDPEERNGYNSIIYNTIISNGTGINIGASNWNTVNNNTVSTCSYGIHLAGSRNNTVTYNTVNSSSEYGIYLNQGMQGSVWIGSDENTLTSNTVTSVSITGGIGIYIQLCIDNTLSSNTVSYYEDGIRLSYSYSNIDQGNTLTTNNISKNYWGIHLYSSNNNSLTGNNVSDNAGGIWLELSSDYNTLTGNSVTNNTYSGIYLSTQSNNNTLTNNTSSSNRDGIKLNQSSENTLTGNTASNNDYGFYLLGSGTPLIGSDYNSLEYNTASSNGYGIKLENSSNNTLTNNTVSNNTLYGIWLDPSNNNQIYNNNFIDNATQAWADSDSTDNLFNLALPIGGNYWSDWSGSGPYAFTGGQDELPWATQDGWLPIANAGNDQTVECACQQGGTKVTLDGTGSTGALTYEWTGPFLESPIGGATPTVTLDPGCLGDYLISLVINNGQYDSDTDTVIITVVDTTPPDVSHPGDITIEAMGPDPVPVSDERIQTFLAGAAATDNCDPEPTITNDSPVAFSPGDTTVTFTATDESGNSSSCSSTVTVVEAAEANLRIIPPIINRESRLEKILAVIRFPEGVTEEDIDIGQPLILYPGDSLDGIEAINQRIVTWYRWGTLRVSIFASFSKDEVTAAVPEDGLVEMMVIGRFIDGQYFYGLDTVRIISWDWQGW